ncbi:hypothetical protein CDV49_14275 [Haematobacter genomosp. 1]|uniref:Uncharacterized protein n=1 Tax=Haematobacter genomosp. 1 TaxID=366618 RepID=A0A212A9W2_9RHOB|nr:hypothetical protein CDV49_14275 [Haematobacter genomosp. 1]
MVASQRYRTSFRLGGLMLSECLVIAQNDRAGEPWGGLRVIGWCKTVALHCRNLLHRCILSQPGMAGIVRGGGNAFLASQRSDPGQGGFNLGLDGTGGIHARDTTTETGRTFKPDPRLDTFLRKPRNPKGFFWD